MICGTHFFGIRGSQSFRTAELYSEFPLLSVELRIDKVPWMTDERLHLQMCLLNLNKNVIT